MVGQSQLGNPSREARCSFIHNASSVYGVDQLFLPEGVLILTYKCGNPTYLLRHANPIRNTSLLFPPHFLLSINISSTSSKFGSHDSSVHLYVTLYVLTTHTNHIDSPNNFPIDNQPPQVNDNIIFELRLSNTTTIPITDVIMMCRCSSISFSGP